ncbi:MAG: hypothetical protein CSB19_01440 [Clostridiales bacterium]|nr:MAG: hypothetical protein CSB19_01440 [Clostridiales bacterium]
MKNNYLKRLTALLLSLVLIATSINTTAYADAKKYQVRVENGRLEIQNYSIEKEYRDLIKAIVATAADEMTARRNRNRLFDGSKYAQL